jgi:hypothetical protein
MKTNFGGAQVIETRPLPAGSIDCLLARLDEREKFNLLGDSAGLTAKDIEEKVKRVKVIIGVTSQVMTDMPSSALGVADFLYLMRENTLLRQEIEKIKQRLSEFEERIPEEKVIVLREIPREQAKQEVQQLFSSGRTLYYSDIAEELKLDLELVVDICRELEGSGEVKIDDSSL